MGVHYGTIEAVPAVGARRWHSGTVSEPMMDRFPFLPFCRPGCLPGVAFFASLPPTLSVKRFCHAGLGLPGVSGTTATEIYVKFWNNLALILDTDSHYRISD